MQSQGYSNAVMPQAASGLQYGIEAGTLDTQAQQQQPQQHQQQQQQHQQAIMAQAASAAAYSHPPSMAGHGPSATAERLVGTGFQPSSSGGSHMQSNSVSSIDSNVSMQHDVHAPAPAPSILPANVNNPAQQQQGYPYAANNAPAIQQQQQLAQQQQQQQHAAHQNESAFVFDSSSVPQNSALPQHQLNFDGAPLQQQFQAPSAQPIQASNASNQQTSQHQLPQPLVFQHDPSSGSCSTRSSPTMSYSTLDTPTVGSSMSVPFGYTSGTAISATGNHGQASGTAAAAAGSSASSTASAFHTSISTPPIPVANSGETSRGAESVGQQTVQQNMQPSKVSTASGSTNTSHQSSPIDMASSTDGLTLGQMDIQLPLQQHHLQQQQTLQQHQGQSLSAVQPRMTQEHLSSAQGQELAVKACADLSNSYNKIADVLRQYEVVDMPTRIRMRQEFCNSVSALDRAFFLSPAGPGYIGAIQDDSQSTRKRAYTVNSADGDDPNKHRRTISVASDGRSELSTTLITSPHSVGAYATRPPLGQHTHSSPLLPAESHYRATSAGMDTIPGPKASDLAVSGSHLVGRPVISTQLYQSVLASDSMLTDATPGPVQDGIAPSQIQAQSSLVNAGILSPTPVSAPGVHIHLGGMQSHAAAGFTGQPLYSQDLQQNYFADGVDPSRMQIQPSTTPTPNHQQTYVTPPMEGVPNFASHGAGMQYMASDMGGQEAHATEGHVPPAPAATPTSVSLSHSGGSTRSRPSTRSGHPGSLDFTTLRSKEDDGSVTSPYASSHLSSMSSFPFTNSATSQTSGSRSRATSISRNTSASRSRAQSINSMHSGLAHGPDAQELQNILGSLNALPSPINEDDDDDDQSNADGNAAAGKRDVLNSELLATYNKVFLQWLPRICADVEATDRKGEKIHQPLMAKKMAKLDEEHAFRPFKFRIQPFTNSFQDACKDLGLSDADTAPKLIKHFLWNQPLISRFNDEGKKTKSRGNHVWSIEARYLAPGHYEFRPPPPKIVPLPATAAPNVPWSWSPKVLDSSCQGPPMSATFSCCNLPPWLEFRDGTLQGTPPQDAKSVMLDIAADYIGHKLVQTFTIAVVAEDGVRPVANNSPAREEQLNSMQSHYNQTPVMAGKGHQGNYSGSSFSSELTHSTNSIMTPPLMANVQANNTLLPSPIPALGPDGHMSIPNGHSSGGKMMPTMMPMGGSVAPSPTSPAQAMPYGNPMAQPVPFYLPTHPTDVTTLASANHIKAKLVEATTIHHENMSALNPQHPPPDPTKVSVAVDAAINRQLAMSSSQPAMPTATEVFNATLEVSTRSQQMQQEQFTHAVSAVTQNLQQLPQHQHQQHPQLSTQVTSQLANFSFTPSNTPGNSSPETAFISQQ